MIIGLHHVGRTVVDLRAAVRDLHAITGWPVTIRPPGDPLIAGHDHTASALAAGPNGWIELIEIDAERGPRREVCDPGVTHAAIQVGEIEHVIARLDASAVKRHPGPVELGTGFRYLYVRDSEHLITEVEGAPHAPSDIDAWLGHGAIATHDIDRLRSAYEELLGNPASSTARLRNLPAFDQVAELVGVDVTATWVPTSNAAVEIWQYHNPPTVENPRVDYEHPGSSHLAFESEDVEGDLQRALAAGFTSADELVDHPDLRIARILDPDGNWVELFSFHDELDPRSLRTRPDLGRVTRMNALLH